MCQNDAVDDACADGKYKKCAGGKWEDVACDGNASCNAENKCGVCQNDAVDDACADGKYKKCAAGKWEDVACEGDASCNAENKCGECKNDAVDDACADGKYKKCAAGKWEDVACEGNASCNAENKCGECSDGEEKADCKDGKYSKCVNGKWTETECADNSSCTKEGTCGKCHEGDIKDCENDASGIGMATICKDGQWSDTKVKCPSESGDVSCTADKKCGECLTGDSKDCQNQEKDIADPYAENEDVVMIGQATLCKDGKWSDVQESCPNEYSCKLTNNTSNDTCYECYSNCDSKHGECAKTTCTEKYNKCIADCGACESKCGECQSAKLQSNAKHKDCTNDSGIGSAQFCINGTYSHQSCKYLRSIDVSCQNESTCGMCQNTPTDKFLCLEKNNPYGYDIPANFPSVLAQCKNGVIDDKTAKGCKQNACNEENGACEPI